MRLVPDQVPHSAWAKAGLAWLALLTILGFYWLQLHHAHQAQIAEAEQRAQLRASQTAHALAFQVESQFRHINFIARHLAGHWTGRDDAEFRKVVTLAKGNLPAGALIQVAVADADGRVVFSSLGLKDQDQDQSRPAVSIADREHFLAHLGTAAPSLFISAPVVGRVSNTWTVQLSLAMHTADGRLSGVIVLSISVEHLSSAFRSVFPDPADVVLLLLRDGRYLTRNHGLESALGKRLPAEREFLRNPEQQQGVYRATAAVDGITRYYAWQRIPGYPVILSLGLGLEKVLLPTHEVIAYSHMQNVVGSTLLLLSALWITGLFLLKARQTRYLMETREHLRQAVEAVRDGLWSWDVDSGRMHWDARCHELLGYPKGRLPSHFSDWCALLHPLDRDKVQAVPGEYLNADKDQVIAIECRLQSAEGHYTWVELRGRMIRDPVRTIEYRFVGTCTDISVRVAENQLRHALLDKSSAAILLVTPGRRIIQTSARAQQLFATPGHSLVGEDTRILHLSDAHFASMEDHYATVWRTGELRTEYPLQSVNGDTLWFDMHGLVCDPDDPRSNVVWTLTDITDRHVAEQALEMQGLRLTTLLERFSAGVLLEDANRRVVMANRSLCRLLGLELDPKALEGLSHLTLLERLSPERAVWLRLPGSDSDKRRMMEASDSLGHTLEIDWVPIVRGNESLGHVWLLRDITERKNRERELATLASTDALTGLPNRRSFMAVLAERTGQLRATPPCGALLMLDIDHFKRVNDTYGHPVGDLVLQHAARVIRQTLRQEDHAGRLGGEEFGVLLHRTTAEESLLLAERLRASIESRPATTEAGAISLTISIGVVELEAFDSQTALSLADQALYQAKNSGRNRVCMTAPQG